MIKKATGKDGIDILLTNQWPDGVCNLGYVLLEFLFLRNQSSKIPKSSPLIAKLVKYLKPRYHFAASYENSPVSTPSSNDEIGKGGVFYTRNPYENLRFFTIV